MSLFAFALRQSLRLQLAEVMEEVTVLQSLRASDASTIASHVSRHDELIQQNTRVRGIMAHSSGVPFAFARSLSGLCKHHGAAHVHTPPPLDFHACGTVGRSCHQLHRQIEEIKWQFEDREREAKQAFLQDLQTVHPLATTPPLPMPLAPLPPRPGPSRPVPFLHVDPLFSPPNFPPWLRGHPCLSSSSISPLTLPGNDGLPFFLIALYRRGKQQPVAPWETRKPCTTSSSAVSKRSSQQPRKRYTSPLAVRPAAHPHPHTPQCRCRGDFLLAAVALFGGLVQGSLARVPAHAQRPPPTPCVLSRVSRVLSGSASEAGGRGHVPAAGTELQAHPGAGAHHPNAD